MSGWHIQGQYMETCNCTYLCPCIFTNLAATPTEGDCKAAMALKIERGEKDGVSLDGIAVILLLHSPGAMVDGDFTVGLIIDDAASDAQVDAIATILSGDAGGPMAALAPLVGRMAGIERRAIHFEREGMTYAVTAGDLLSQKCEGVPSMAQEGEPIIIDNTGHPANSRLALAKAEHSRFHAFGIDWEDASGTRNGHFAPFAWAE